MYSSKYSLVVGFHGCDLEVRNKIIMGSDFFQKSENDYDWLGNGIYFWENDPERALAYAQFIKENPERCKTKIKTPSVIGALIDLGLCLDLLNKKNLELLKMNYSLLCKKYDKDKMPKNIAIGDEKDILIRKLDCAVIEITHSINEENNLPSFDSVRGVFWEGKEIYENAGFKEKNHIQICIRNPNCIKGVFIPRNIDNNFPSV